MPKNACLLITPNSFNVNNLDLPSPCPLPAPGHACASSNLLGEGGSFEGGGGRPPPPSNIFPLTSMRRAGKIWKPGAGEGNQRGGACTADCGTDCDDVLSKINY